MAIKRVITLALKSLLSETPASALIRSEGGLHETNKKEGKNELLVRLRKHNR